MTGATAFLAVRSYLSTARKHNHTALADLYTGNGRIPAASVPPPQSHSRVASPSATTSGTLTETMTLRR